MEVMVALGVLAVGIGGALAMFIAAGKIHRQALDETVTAIVADSVIAEIRADFGRGGQRYLTETDERPAPGYPLFNYRVVPTVLGRDPVGGRVIHLYVRVEVTYQRGGRKLTSPHTTTMFRE